MINLSLPVNTPLVKSTFLSSKPVKSSVSKASEVTVESVPSSAPPSTQKFGQYLLPTFLKKSNL